MGGRHRDPPANVLSEVRGRGKRAPLEASQPLTAWVTAMPAFRLHAVCHMLPLPTPHLENALVSARDPHMPGWLEAISKMPWTSREAEQM